MATLTGGDGSLLNQAHASTDQITSADTVSPGAKNRGCTFYVLDSVAGTFTTEVLIGGSWAELTSDALTASTLLVVDVDYPLPASVRATFTPGAATAGRIYCDFHVKE